VTDDARPTDEPFHRYSPRPPRAEALPRSFFERPTPEVAQALLGCRLVREDEEGLRSGIIVEAEAYTGSDDLASHAARGPTPRNRVMFERAGHAYVYFIYGCHHCFNVVAHSPGEAGAVLIRALEPLARGPGLLCRALDIDRGYTGWDLTLGERLWIAPGLPDRPVVCGPRVGIRKAMEKPWRFWIAGNRWVSGGRGGAGLPLVEPAIRRRGRKAPSGPEEST
jgi:DNA-3-methyladenine glycosylase